MGKVMSPPGHLGEEFTKFSVSGTILATATGGPPILLGTSSVGFLLRFGML